MTFGERLKELMQENDLTQRKLSRDLNIAISTLNGYANNYREPDFATLAQLARYFNVSTDYLLGVSGHTVLPDIAMDSNAQRLFHYYRGLEPGLKALVIDHARLLSKYQQSLEPSNAKPSHPKKIPEET